MTKYKKLFLLCLFMILSIISCNISEDISELDYSHSIIPYELNRYWIYKTKVSINGELKDNFIDSVIVEERIEKFGLQGWLISSYSKNGVEKKKIYIGKNDSIFTESRFINEESNKSLYLAFPQNPKDTVKFLSLDGDQFIMHTVHDTAIENFRPSFAVKYNSSIKGIDIISKGKGLIKSESIGIIDFRDTVITNKNLIRTEIID